MECRERLPDFRQTDNDSLIGEVETVKAELLEGGSPRLVYWHRELPPRDAEAIAEHTLEATSGRVPDTIAHRDELWDRCRDELMAATDERLAAEIVRLGGRCARVLSESIDTKHDPITGEAWLHGRFSYMLYR